MYITNNLGHRYKCTNEVRGTGSLSGYNSQPINKKFMYKAVENTKENVIPIYARTVLIHQAICNQHPEFLFFLQPSV